LVLFVHIEVYEKLNKTSNEIQLKYNIINMEKKLIRVDRYANIGVAHKCNMKVKMFNDALEYCSTFITIDETEKADFSKSFVVFLEKKLRQKGKDFIPTEWSRSRLFDFYQVSESILNEIQHRFLQLRQIQLSEDFKTAIIPDNRIFAETPEQLERLAIVEQIIDAANKVTASKHNVDYSLLAQAFNGCLIWQGHKNLEPNPQYIKRKK